MRLERWRYSVPLRLRGLFRRGRLETDLTDEFRDHLERDIEARVAQGVPIDQARRQAVHAMAGFEQRKEECRDVSSVRIVDEVLADLRYARRTLGRSPGFTAVAVLTLALGIGATTALFSVTYGVLLRPLPWPDPDGLVRLTETRQGRSGRVPGTISNAAYLAWSDRPGTIEAIGGYTRGVRMTLAQVASGLSRKPLDQAATDASAERIVVMPITPSLLTVLKASPLLGRLFTADEGAPDQAGAIILGFGLWQQRFGARHDIIGQTIQLDEKPYTVVGVMPAGFVFPTPDTRLGSARHYAGWRSKRRRAGHDFPGDGAAQTRDDAGAGVGRGYCPRAQCSPDGRRAGDSTLRRRRPYRRLCGTGCRCANGRCASGAHHLTGRRQLAFGDGQRERREHATRTGQHARSRDGRAVCNRRRGGAVVPSASD
jgi:MacB-like periplasmic core domain